MCAIVCVCVCMLRIVSMDKILPIKATLLIIVWFECMCVCTHKGTGQVVSCKTDTCSFLAKEHFQYIQSRKCTPPHPFPPPSQELKIRNKVLTTLDMRMTMLEGSAGTVPLPFQVLTSSWCAGQPQRCRAVPQNSQRCRHKDPAVVQATPEAAAGRGGGDAAAAAAEERRCAAAVRGGAGRPAAPAGRQEESQGRKGQAGQVGCHTGQQYSTLCCFLRLFFPVLHSSRGRDVHRSGVACQTHRFNPRQKQPENVLLQSRLSVQTDFGICSPLPPASSCDCCSR